MQVHYGDSNDIYVKPAEVQKKDKPYILPDVPKPFWDRLYPDNFVRGAYYPHGEFLKFMIYIGIFSPNVTD